MRAGSSSFGVYWKRFLSMRFQRFHPRGWDLWKRIDKNLFQYTPNEEDPARMLGSGEVIFAIDFEKRLLAQQQAKKPVAIHYPAPTYYDLDTVAILAGGKN